LKVDTGVRRKPLGCRATTHRNLHASTAAGIKHEGARLDVRKSPAGNKLNVDGATNQPPPSDYG
jgi:hypothetical protein